MKRTPSASSAARSNSSADTPGEVSNGRKRPWLLALSAVALLAWLGFLLAMALQR